MVVPLLESSLFVNRLKRRRKSVPGTGDNSVCSEARTIWEDIGEAGEDEFIQIGLEIQW